MSSETDHVRSFPASTSKFSGPHDPNLKLHSELMLYGRARMLPSTPASDFDWLKSLDLARTYQHLEVEFVENERRKVADEAASAPTSPKEFVQWFESLQVKGPGQGDALFPWLAQEADVDQMRWFIQQEVAGEAGFDDLLALTQLRMPVVAKLEMARNYWDEMGRGAEPGMHGPMLQGAAEELGIAHQPDTGVIWQAMALGNLMLALAAQRRYAYQSVGCLGVVELTAPGRTRYVADGLKRLGLSKKGYMYFDLHASVDIRHSRDWNRDVIYTLVEQEPDIAPCIAEGALMRLNAGARCFDCYRAHFGFSSSPVPLH